MITEDHKDILRDLQSLSRSHVRTRGVRRFYRSVILQGIQTRCIDLTWDDFPGTEALLMAEISDGRHYPLPTEG